MVLKQAFTEVFKIGDASNDPFDLVTVRPADGFHELSPTYRLIEDFVRYDIGKYYNISVIEFAQLPRHITSHMMEVSRMRQEKESSVASTIATDLNQSVKNQENYMRQQRAEFPNL